MRRLAILLILLDASSLWRSATRDIRSVVAEWRGVRDYTAQRYISAEEALSRADSARPTALSAFNRGTAEIAAGRRDEGAQTLERAMRDGTLHADALFNRATGELARGDHASAIRDYSAVLRLRPSDAAAKRNLEIALKRDAAARAARDRQQQASGGAPAPNQPPAPSAGQKPEAKRGETDLEALLRSVQQQEQEEMARMKRARRDPMAVGW